MKIGLAFAIVSTGAGLLLCPPASAQATEPSDAVRTCIATHAPAVEKTVPSLKEATEFLVGQVCLAPVTADNMAYMQARNAEYQAKLEERCAGRETGSSDTFDPMAAMCANLDMSLGMDMGYAAIFFESGTYLGGGAAAAPATSLAAQTLLKLRSAKAR